jgi:hypothetical protein
MGLQDLTSSTGIFMMGSWKRGFFRGREFFIRNRRINIFLVFLRKMTV